MASDKNYISGEMAAINSSQSDTMCVAFRDPNVVGTGTKWMNISQDTFKQIERLLTLGNEG